VGNGDKFTVTSGGIASVNFNGTATTNGVCHSGTDINTATDTTRDLVACNLSATDYAEWYETQNNVESADVVAVTNQTFTYTEKRVNALTGLLTDEILTHTIPVLAKSTGSAGMLGVVSTSPQQTLGRAVVEAGAQHPQPIVIAGRVPVKVTNENGNIEPGDFLTSSATQPGYAMKATKAGPVIGQALQQFSDATGKVLVFVKATTYNGVAIDQQISGLVFDYSVAPTAAVPTSSAQILDELLAQLPSLNNSNLSQVHADVVVAGAEVITPAVTSSVLRTSILTSASVNGGLSVEASTVFKDGLLVDSIGSLGSFLSFQSDVEFFGLPYFNKDTAGFALIKQGVDSVDVAFTQEYLDQPIVSATISFEQAADLSNITDEDTLNILRNDAISAAQGFLGNGVNYVVTNKSKRGFTIVLNKPAPSDIRFSWIALAVKQATTFSSIDAPAASAPSSPSNLPPDNSPPADSGSGSGGGGTGDSTTPPPPAADGGSGSGAGSGDTSTPPPSS
jgi:hypothetical protein